MAKTLHELTHYSEQPWKGPLDSVIQKAMPGFKPAGLWLSVDGEQDWPTWCERENYCLEALAHASRVVLARDARLLWVSTAEQIDAVSRQYGASHSALLLREDGHPAGQALDKELARMAGVDDCAPWIRWRDVAEHYQGIIIAPYHLGTTPGYVLRLVPDEGTTRPSTVRHLTA